VKVFGVDYAFLSCGSVFTDGLVHAAADLGVDYAHACWDTPDLDSQIAAFVPDLIFVVHGRRFAQRFQNLAGFRHATAVWLLDEPYEVDDTSRWSSRFDHVFVNDPATLDRHERASYLPVCYDPHVHHPGEGVRPHAVGFIGGGNRTRDRYLGALARAGLLTFVVGGEWSDPAVNARCLAGNIRPRQTAALYQGTRIVVNVFREEHHFNVRGTAATSLNPRVYEALACGALVVSEWRPEIDDARAGTADVSYGSGMRGSRGASARASGRGRGDPSQCAARLKAHTYATRLLYRARGDWRTGDRHDAARLHRDDGL
jgi:hypothetical protein